MQLNRLSGNSRDMGWKDKQAHCAGSVFFRGQLAPRPEEFSHLEKQGVTLRATPEREGSHWHLTLAHPKWGTAQAMCLKHAPLPPRVIFEWDPGLTDEERQEAQLGASSVSVIMEGVRGDILRDRKALLWFLGAIAGQEGVVAIDHSSERCWSRASLDEELCHDASLDIEAMFVLHAVRANAESKTTDWLHTHGLASIGLLDFDILRPSAELLGRSRDLLRAIALGIAEGGVTRNMPSWRLAGPAFDVGFMDAASFMAAGPRWARDIRTATDKGHTEDRTILVEPGKWWKPRRLFGAEPSRFLSGEQPDDLLIQFSDDATFLMQTRARAMYPLLRRLAEEMREFDFTVAVKLGYEADAGNGRKEHLWFRVHAAEDTRVDATLLNHPFNIARIHKGERGWHDTGRLTDWMILTPLGQITPRDVMLARRIRANRDKLLKLMREQRATAK
ncbi:MAG: DUF4026 domain-containing protein [Tepidisphaeraceae bacterium]